MNHPTTYKELFQTGEIRNAIEVITSEQTVINLNQKTYTVEIGGELTEKLNE